MDYRVEDESVLLKKRSKKTVKIELFFAEQWKNNRTPGSRNMWPQPPWKDDEWWTRHYRVRIDGRWYRRTKRKYHFLTRAEAFALIATLAGEDL